MDKNHQKFIKSEQWWEVTGQGHCYYNYCVITINTQGDATHPLLLCFLTFNWSTKDKQQNLTILYLENLVIIKPLAKILKHINPTDQADFNKLIFEGFWESTNNEKKKKRLFRKVLFT